MKDNKRLAKVKLDIGDTDEHVLLLGISSTDPDYKLTLALNKKLKISLRNSKPVEITSENRPPASFSRFIDTSGLPDISYYLVSNRSDKHFLFKKFSRIDFFLSIFHSYGDNESEKLIRNVKETEGVTALFLIEPCTIDYTILQS